MCVLSSSPLDTVSVCMAGPSHFYYHESKCDLKSRIMMTTGKEVCFFLFLVLGFFSYNKAVGKGTHGDCDKKIYMC